MPTIDSQNADSEYIQFVDGSWKIWRNVAAAVTYILQPYIGQWSFAHEVGSAGKRSPQYVLSFTRSRDSRVFTSKNAMPVHAAHDLVEQIKKS